MKIGWLFFVNALRLLWRNRIFALGICLPIYLVVVVLDIWIRLDVLGELSPASIPWPIDDPYIEQPEDSMTWNQAIFKGAIWLLTVVMMAILWHRRVLASRGIAPATPLGWLQPAAYILKLMGIWLLPAIPLGIFFSLGVTYFIAGDIGDVGWNEDLASSISFWIWSFALFTAYGWAIMRLSLALPEAAMGIPGSIFDSWAETRPFAMPLLITALLEVLLFMVPEAVSNRMAIWSEPSAYLVETVLYWGALMVGISILTLLYEKIHFERSMNTPLP